VGVDRHIARAFELAHNSFRTHPNPRVGAVVVNDSGAIVGEGHHVAPGYDHAEVVALNHAGTNARGATMFVSLEPCNHHGRTPPCTDALIEAGVGHVVVAVEDPDPRVSGQGIERLRGAGIEVDLLEIDELARGVDPAYFRHQNTGLPTVTLKWAMTLDGSVAASDGSSRWITSDLARQEVHALRARSDAVVVGAGTLRVDDPVLDVRVSDNIDEQPVPVIVAGSGALPPDRKIWRRNPLVVTTDMVNLPGGEVVLVDGQDGLPDPIATCRALAERGLLSILLEGGPTLSSAWWAAGVVTKGVAWVGSKIGGGSGISPFSGTFANIADADVVSIQTVRNVGDDVVITFEKK
jgi:diaminohydroxyphosphoribosylaminopyrimidine deaminase / 5-amino-6-(5-phosphoribosylamino)uracil reductase